jgi:hypothetical protein
LQQKNVHRRGPIELQGKNKKEKGGGWFETVKSFIKSVLSSIKTMQWSVLIATVLSDGNNLEATFLLDIHCSPCPLFFL